MARVRFNPALGISSISGKLGNYIFYTRNGKQYVRRFSKEPSARSTPSDPTDSAIFRVVSEPSSSHSRAVSESNPV